jgi:YtkA-like
VVIRRRDTRKFAVCAVFLLLAAGMAYAKDYSVGKKVGPYDVSIRMDNNPAVIGANRVTLKIRNDAAQENDLDPEVYYFMQSMPAMSYTAHARRNGDAYTAVIKPTMPGEWTMQVKIKGPDGGTYSGTFEFKAE